VVFVLVAKVLFRGETLELRHYLALLLVLVAVWLAA
jgi:drug/metabolite transporter (DMT)-like permease